MRKRESKGKEGGLGKGRLIVGRRRGGWGLLMEGYHIVALVV